ncbi:hypothetical protein KSC_093710 [Ktedonobacter sp. SOSP1-52]|nr:hypothetical protein KSC_093710 [Ktedonobacter sp. SOSP1-52]
MGTTMFEHMQTPLKHLGGDGHACIFDRFEQVRDVFDRMRKIQNANGIRPMPLDEGLAPVCSIGNGTNMLSLSYAAATYLGLS